jgi:ADP-heptose:LPS heptosyltransferase
MIPVWLQYGERLGWLCRRVRCWPRSALLVIKPGSLGDALLFTGALRVLRQRYPGHRIVLVSDRHGAPVFERSPDADVRLTLDASAAGQAGWLARLRRIWFAAGVLRRRYALAVVCHADCGWAQALLSCVVAERKLLLTDERGTVGAGVDAVRVSRGAHELDKTLALLQAAGCRVAARRDMWPAAWIRVEEREWAREAVGKARTEDDMGEKQKAESGKLKLGIGDNGGFNRKERKERKESQAGLQGRWQREGFHRQGRQDRQEDQAASQGCWHREGINRKERKGREESQAGLQGRWHREGFSRKERKESQPALQGCWQREGINRKERKDGDLAGDSFVLALCPGARFKQKQWGAEKFAELIVELGERLGEGQTEDGRLRTEGSFKLQPSTLFNEEAGTNDQGPDSLGHQSSVISHPPNYPGHPSPVSLRVLIVGGEEDREIAGEIIGKVESGKLKVEMGREAHAEARRAQRNINGEPPQPSILLIEDWTGGCTLHQSMALIEASDLCIGNDTFGLHVAVAVGTPSVVLMWGGDGDQWIPWGDPGKHRMVRADVDCGGCEGLCEKGGYACMEQISVEMVMEEVEKLKVESGKLKWGGGGGVGI